MAITHRSKPGVGDATPRIVRNPRILGGEPTVVGTRIPVRSVVLKYEQYKELPAVCAALDLDLAAVEQALAFYKDHHAEIDRHIRENQLLAETPGLG